MATLTNYGGIWAMIPNTAGRVFWVAPAASYTIDGDSFSASDDNDGLRPERALRTVDRAWNLVTANVGDVIVLLPGTHTVSTASSAWDIAGVTITGLPGGKGNFISPRTIITTDITADEIANITAADIEVAHLYVRPITAARGLDFTGGASRLYVHDCGFDLVTPAANTSTIGIGGAAATSAPVDVLIENCMFRSDAAQGPGAQLSDAQNFVVRNCVFTVEAAATWAAALAHNGVLGWGVIHDCIFLAQQGGAMTIGIRGTDLTSASSVGIFKNFFGDDVTVPIDDYGAGDAYISENYKASIGVASGGVLWSSIT